MDIATLVRNSSSGIFPDTHEWHERSPKKHLPRGIFGVKEEHASTLLYISSPWHAFSFWDRLFLPRPLKDCIKYPNDFYPNYGRNGIYIFHYPLKRKSIDEHLDKFASWKSNEERITSFRTWFHNTYPNPSCIWFSIEAGVVVGNKEVAQAAMDYLKTTPLAFKQFLGELVYDRPQWFQKKEKVGIHLYDLLRVPSEVHYTL